MSVEERRNRVATEFHRLFQADDGATFAERLQRLVYVQAFLDLFPKLAPDAWSTLLVLRTRVDALVIPILRREQRTTMEPALRLTRAWVRGWSEKHGVAADWFEHVAAATLIDYSISNYLRTNPPDGFTFFQERYFLEDEDGDVPHVAIEKLKITPETIAWVSVDPGVQSWNTSEETKAQFRARAIQEYTELLDRELDALGPISVTPKTPEVNYAWVEWAILVRVAGRSVRSVAEQYRVSRPAVDKGVAKAMEILRLPKHATASEST